MSLVCIWPRDSAPSVMPFLSQQGQPLHANLQSAQPIAPSTRLHTVSAILAGRRQTQILKIVPGRRLLCPGCEAWGRAHACSTAAVM